MVFLIKMVIQLVNYNPWESDFYTTDLEDALKIRDTKTIIEF